MVCSDSDLVLVLFHNDLAGDFYNRRRGARYNRNPVDCYTWRPGVCYNQWNGFCPPRSGGCSGGYIGDDSHIPEEHDKGVYRRARKDKSGTVTHYRYEPRFKPPRERLENCPVLKFNYLPLGSYKTPEEAKIMCQIAAFFYGKGESSVQLEDGLSFSIPSVSDQERCPPSGQEKADWVAREAKAVYAFLLKERARIAVHLENPALEAGSDDGHDRDVTRRDSPPSTWIDASSSPGTCNTVVAVTCFTSSDGGNGVEQLIAPESNWSSTESIPVAELFSDLLSRHVAGDDFKTACVCGIESVSPVLPQSRAFHIPTTALDDNLPQLDGGAQGLELVESRLSPTTMTSLHQMESVPRQARLQQLVTCQERHLTEFAGWNIELQQKLRESEEKNRVLQQKLRESEEKNRVLQQKLSQSEAHSTSLQRKFEQLKTMFQ